VGEITQHEIDLLADILWWVKGYRASGTDPECPFTADHERAMQKIKITLQERLQTGGSQ